MTRVQWMLNRETLTWSKIDKDVYDAAIRCSKIRTWDAKHKKKVTSYPDFREILELIKVIGRSCTHCGVEMDVETPEDKRSKEIKNWRLMTIDRKDTDSGEFGNGRLVRTDVESPVTKKGTMVWESCNGYKGNSDILCFGCNRVKCTVSDKYHYANGMLTRNTAEERMDYYAQRQFENKPASIASIDYFWAIARYLYPSHTVPCLVPKEDNECDICGGHSSRYAWYPSKGWCAVCTRHNYSQWNVLTEFDRVYYNHLRQNPATLSPTEKTRLIQACDSVLSCTPDESQLDITTVAKRTAELFRDLVISKPVNNETTRSSSFTEEDIPEMDDWEEDEEPDDVDMDDEDPEDEE